MTTTKPDYYHGMDAQSLKWSFQDHLEFSLAKNRFTTTDFDRFFAAALTVRDRLVERWMRTQDVYYERDAKRVYYLSMEFLIGRTLGNALVNLDLYAELRAATPDSLHGLLADLLETITLWDVRAEQATAEPTGTGEYQVTLTVGAKKMRADGRGREQWGGGHGGRGGHDGRGGHGGRGA